MSFTAHQLLLKMSATTAAAHSYCTAVAVSEPPADIKCQFSGNNAVCTINAATNAISESF